MLMTVNSANPCYENLINAANACAECKGANAYVQIGNEATGSRMTGEQAVNMVINGE